MQIVSFFGGVVDSDCEKCGLNKNTHFPRMPLTGKGQKGILIVGESPTISESKKGQYWTGEIGEFLDKSLSMVDIDLIEDCWTTSAVLCPSGDKVSDKHIKLCQKNLIKTIEELKPKAVILLGSVAIKSLIGKHVHTTSPTSLSGNCIPFFDYNCWVYPSFHPSFVLRGKNDDNLRAYFKWNLKFISDHIHREREVPKLDYITPVQVSTDPDEIITWIEDKLLNNPDKPITALDIESSGLNPFQKGHSIYCLSISTKDECISFPIDYPGAYTTSDDLKDVVDVVCEYLEREDLKKVAHRSQFENAWFTNVLDCRPAGMHWCTKVGEHLCDNRKDITGLKHIAFRRWGVHSYGESMDTFIKSKDGLFNRMHQAPLHEMLLYCGVDSYLTIKLYWEQLAEIGPEPMDFFNEVSNMFCEMTEHGIRMNEEHYTKEKERIRDLITKSFDKLNSSPEVIKYAQEFSPMKWNSSTDLKKFFFTFLKCESVKTTKTGANCLDEDSLAKMDHWIAQELIQIRKWTKVVDTYIAQFEREVVDGVIHPIFNVYTARSFRSSSSNPNF